MPFCCVPEVKRQPVTNAPRSACLGSLSSVSQTDSGCTGESWESHRTLMGDSRGITLASAGPPRIQPSWRGTEIAVCYGLSCVGSAGTRGEASDDLEVLLQGPGIVIPAPRNAIVALDQRGQGPEGHSRVGQLLDVLTRQRDAQTFGHKGHEGGLQLGVLQYPRGEARLLACFSQPFAETWMGPFGHADKEHRFQFAEAYLGFAGQRMFGGQHHDRSVAGDALDWKRVV